MTTNFVAASKAAKSWINTVSLVAQLGERESVDQVYRLLLPPADNPDWPCLQASFRRHSETLRNSFGELAVLSDGPVVWEHGRGLSAIAGSPEGVYPHEWTSAHEAAHGIAGLAIDLLVAPLEGINDPHEQTSSAKQLLSGRWKALVIPIDEAASLQERIRRERAKLLQESPDPTEAYVAISKIGYQEHFDSYRKAKKFLDDCSEIKTRGSGQRFLVHAADWVRYWDEHGVVPGDAVLERIQEKLEERKAEARQRRQ